MRRGFSFIEVMVSLMILGFASYILAMQATQVFKVREAHAFVERIFWVKRYLYETVIKKQDAQLKDSKASVDELKTSIVTTISPVTKKSELAPFQNRLQVVTTEGAWKDVDKNKSLTMVAYIYRTPEPKS